MDNYEKVRNERNILTLAEKVSEEFAAVDIKFNGVKNNFDFVHERIKELDLKISYLNILIEKHSNSDLNSVK